MAFLFSSHGLTNGCHSQCFHISPRVHTQAKKAATMSHRTPAIHDTRKAVGTLAATFCAPSERFMHCIPLVDAVRPNRLRRPALIPGLEAIGVLVTTPRFTPYPAGYPYSSRQLHPRRIATPGLVSHSRFAHQPAHSPQIGGPPGSRTLPGVRAKHSCDPSRSPKHERRRRVLHPPVSPQQSEPPGRLACYFLRRLALGSTWYVCTPG